MATQTSKQYAPGSLIITPKQRRSVETTKTSTTQPLSPYTGDDFSSTSINSTMDFYQSHSLPEWHDDAACSEPETPQEWFFGAEEQPGKKRHRPTLNMAEVRRAQEICIECPVMQKCLIWALENKEEFGVWGGTTGRDRAKWWRANGIVVGGREEDDEDQVVDLVGEEVVESDAEDAVAS